MALIVHYFYESQFISIDKLTIAIKYDREKVMNRYIDYL
jgi:hypothetical protein